MWPLALFELIKVTNAQNINSDENILIYNITSDSRKLKNNSVFIAIKGEYFDGHDFVKQVIDNGAVAVFVKNNWFNSSIMEDKYKNKCLIVYDTEQSFRQIAQKMRESFLFPVIGIGGSNGKTTTKEMLASMLSGNGYKITKTEKSENGFLGMAITLCQENHNINYNPDALVLEIGIDTLGSMAKHCEVSMPNIVALTALGPEHIEGLQTYEKGITEELILFNHDNKVKKVWQLCDNVLINFLYYLVDNDVIVYKNNDILVEEKIKEIVKNKNIYKLIFDYKEVKSENSIIICEWLFNNKLIYVMELNIPLPGIHNVHNAVLAMGIALSLGRTPDEIYAGFCKFIAPPMRSNVLHLSNNNILLNDCYNASPASVIAALNSLEIEEWSNKNKIIFLADMKELGIESEYWHIKIAEKIIKMNISVIIFYGTEIKNTYNAVINNNLIKSFYISKEQNIEDSIDLVQNLLFNAVILVKGSRSMGMERIVNKLMMSLTLS